MKLLSESQVYFYTYLIVIVFCAQCGLNFVFRKMFKFLHSYTDYVQYLLSFACVLSLIFFSLTGFFLSIILAPLASNYFAKYIDSRCGTPRASGIIMGTMFAVVINFVFGILQGMILMHKFSKKFQQGINNAQANQ